MNREDVLTGLGILRAGFPHSTVPAETVELYVSRLMVYDAAVFAEVVKEILDADDHFPTLHRIVEGCRGRRKREQAEVRFSGELAPGVPNVILPDVARAYRDAITEKFSDDELEAALAKIPSAPAGRCDECHQDARTMRRYGKFLLCEGCCSRRLGYALAKGLVAA
jgi:hypothetical protein